MFVNLTPHEVTILDKKNCVVKSIPPSGTVARLVTDVKDKGFIEGVRITKTDFYSIDGLPPFEKGIYLIVSQMVKNSYLSVSRNDLLVPTDIVRENGKILGCRALGA